MAKNEVGNGKPTTFLSIDFKTGLLFEAKKSTDKIEIDNLEKRGFQRVVNVNPQTKQEVVSYRKYYKSVSGYVNGVKIDDSPFGQQLRIRIEDNTEVNFINIPLWNVKGSMSGHAVDFIRMTPNIPLDERVCIGANKNLKNEEGYLVQIMNINYEERVTNNRKDLVMRMDKTLIPQAEVTTIGTKKSYDSKKRDAYLYQVLEDYIKRVEERKFRVSGDEETKVVYNPASDNVSSPAEAVGQDVPPAAYIPGNIPVDGKAIDDLPF